tara:strand:- start:43 stop:399 length:357 start_codon:yes stop_codon:yes gene_type:complete
MHGVTGQDAGAPLQLGLGSANQPATNKKGWVAVMPPNKSNLQDTFLNHVRKEKLPVTVFLINGVKLQGMITWFDNFCVLLRRDGHAQLVYKHAISTVMPEGPIRLFEGSEDDEAVASE